MKKNLVALIRSPHDGSVLTLELETLKEALRYGDQPDITIHDTGHWSHGSPEQRPFGTLGQGATYILGIYDMELHAGRLRQDKKAAQRYNIQYI